DSLKGVPVIIGKERSLAGKLAVERFGTDVLILDDAFQHRRLSRDIDIVLLDSEKPFGNGFVLPRGDLREPEKALQRADTIIFTSTEGGPDPATDNMPAVEIPQIPIFMGYRRARELVGGEEKNILPLEYLKGKRICAFSGIANPDSFRRILEPLCGGITVFIPFPDHHVYTGKDIEHIREACRESRAELILTTEKDGIKLIESTDFFRDIYRLRMEMEIIPSSLNFEEYILTRLET
ncbi:MAG: tetraacyldisaccharide 4'-kinase, partial [Syntrophobacterales bacterium]|nr:tetraacyldisaccharide 4'-kinase [Syntrophobacterales bacterium]